MISHRHFQTLRVPLLGQVYVSVSGVVSAASLIVLLRGIHPLLVDFFTSFFLQYLIAF